MKQYNSKQRDSLENNANRGFARFDRDVENMQGQKRDSSTQPNEGWGQAPGGNTHPRGTDAPDLDAVYVWTSSREEQEEEMIDQGDYGNSVESGWRSSTLVDARPPVENSWQDTGDQAGQGGVAGKGSAFGRSGRR